MNPVPYGLAVGTWLPYSETFVLDQVRQSRRLRPHVLARDRARSGPELPEGELAVLSPLELALYMTVQAAPRFRRALRRSGARLIHAHFGTNGALVANLARSLDLPLAVTYHGVDVGALLGHNVPSRYRFYHRIHRRPFETAQLLLPASQELADCLVSLGAPADRIRVHRLGVELDRFAPVARPERPARFLMVGRQVEKKGFEYGLRAFARIAPIFPEATLSLAGRGPLEASLRALAAELGVSERTRFLGAVPAAEMPRLLADHDVLVAPCVVAADNDRDSGLIVLKEAGATAMASVGTFCGGLPEILDDGATGCLVPQRAVDALAQAIEALAADPALRARMGLAARAKMEREYDTLRQNEILEDLLLGLL